MPLLLGWAFERARPAPAHSERKPAHCGSLIARHGIRRMQIATAPPASPQAYQLTTKQGTMTFQTGDEWLAAWAKLVRSCKAARALDKLQIARQTNLAHAGHRKGELTLSD